MDNLVVKMVYLWHAVNLFCLTSVLLLTQRIQAFNVDVTNVKTWKGPIGSHFGYTLAFDMNSFKQGKFSLLVGAPKEVTNYKGKSISSGTLQSCTYLTDELDCSNSSYHLPEFYTEFERGKSFLREGYGSSLSISKTGNVVVCASFWKDLALVQQYGLSFQPGRCTMEVQKDTNTREILDVSPYYHTVTDGTTYLPGLFYYHGLATFGISTDSTESSTFAFGSPGLNIFEGGIDLRDYERGKYTTTLDEYKNAPSEMSYGYLGYDVKIGKFCDDDEVCVAAGAPNLRTTGTVRLYRWIERKLLFNHQTLEGDQSWSYFGSVLCVVDADGDSVDELLVGAPYYSDFSSNSLDTGKVYFYTRDELTKQYNLHHVLKGSGAKHSRFGTAIQSIGDINLDGYTDVLIGSPGEEEGTGCVYLYLGSPEGLALTHSQRVCANEIPGHANLLKGFGSTISGSIQLLPNSSPSFAVSSYLTDTILMFAARPVVRVNATITASPNPIDMTNDCAADSSLPPCTHVDVCYSLNILGAPSRKLNFVVALEMDFLRRSGVDHRVAIMDPRGVLVDGKGDIQIGETEICHNLLVITKKDQIIHDRVTPIEMKFTLELDEGKPNKDINPIMDSTVPNSFIYMIYLANDCGSDNVCNVDLSVQGAVIYSHQEEWPYVVVGYTKELRVDLTISNTQETSYGVIVTTEVNQPLRFIKFESDTVKHCKPTYTSKRTVVSCSHYQPLRKSSSIKVVIDFDVQTVAMDQKSIHVVAKAAPSDPTYSIDRNPDDNEFRVTSPVFIVADVDTHGIASPTEVTIKSAKRLSLDTSAAITKNFTQHVDGFDSLILNHKYQMKNLGPSFLPRTSIYLSIPVYLPDASQFIAGVSVRLQSGDDGIIACRMVDKIIVPEETTTYPYTTTQSGKGGNGDKSTKFNPGVNRRKKRDTGKDATKTYVMNCDTFPKYCIHFKCDLETDTARGGHAELNVTFDIDRKNIPVPAGFSTFNLQLTVFVQEPNHILFKAWTPRSKESASKSTSTLFHTVESGGEVDLGVIIGSVLAGLFIIVIIAIIFWKLGFFKRDKRYQVEEWKRQSKEATTPPASTNDESKETAT